MRFKFPLQRLLDLKARREQEMARQLAEAQRVADAESARRDSLSALRQESVAQVASHATGPTSVGALVSLASAVSQIEARIDVATERVATAAHDVALKTGDLSSAMRERQVLDRLRDRKLEQFRVEDQRQDQQTMDAIALTRFSNRTAADDSNKD
jgi:flagellar FliJ protein